MKYLYLPYFILQTDLASLLSASLEHLGWNQTFNNVSNKTKSRVLKEISCKSTYS